MAETPKEIFADRTILVGIGGGIAAFKTAMLVSRLVQHGARVQVLMTEAATRFITPLTLESLSGRPVFTSIWQSMDRPDSQHIALARQADLAIVAPATADLIARLTAGFCDDVVSLVLSALPRDPVAVPVLLAPGMNEQMWRNPIVRRNVAQVRELLGWRLVGPESGWQACRTSGEGRMSEPEAILEAAARLLSRASAD
ncbi:MAG: phosphopantothenoylcysteine decarboxylase [Phycisphaeraceae bacterium]|nr:phosphopantothenoylcysteine decarboxylase [Phycisphaeraceae bacterium]